MPYIKKDRRHQVWMEFPMCLPENAGELNYTITTLLIDYFGNHHNYQGINDILGALEGAKLEFYRRVAVPYENGKIKSNGDVYDDKGMEEGKS